MRKFSVLFKSSLIFVFFLVLFSLQSHIAQATFDWGQWGEWTETSECVANQCGTTEGTKTQERIKTKEVCEFDCPEVTFSDSREVVDVPGHWGECPDGYQPHSSNKCKKWIDDQHELRYADKFWFFGWHCPSSSSSYTSQDSSKPCSKLVKVQDARWDIVNRPWIDTTYKTETFGPITFKYNKSNDPNKCHRPTPPSLNIPTWAIPKFNQLPEHKNSIKTNCHQEEINRESRTISCQIPEEEVTSCPTGVPSMSSDVSCGKADLTFKNPTPWFFSFDYRVDNEAGTDDQYTNMQIANGPWAGHFFGQRFNIVDVPAGTEQAVPITFPEDTGSHLVEYRLWRGAENDLYLDWESVQVESNCKPNEEPEPTPTPLPEPTPSPNPEAGNKSSLASDRLQCPNAEFEAVMDLKRDGLGVKDVKVTFKFNGSTKEANTNQDGRAKVSFFIADGTLTAEADGFPSQSLSIKAPEGCEPQSSEETGRGGQVLGATTLAATGSQSLYQGLTMVLSGLTLTAASAYGYIKAKKTN